MSKAAELANLIGNINAGGGGVNRNLLINSDFAVAQRGTSSTAVDADGYYTCDRWKYIDESTGGQVTLTQDSSVPTGSGLSKSFKVDCTTADTSVAADHSIRVQQRIEGQNLQGVAKGTSDAKPLVCSFYVKSNLTGQFNMYLEDTDNSRAIAGTYSISSADTWEYKTVRFPADTTGAFTNDANMSLVLHFFLAGGTNFTSGTIASAWQSKTLANLGVGMSNNILSSTSNDWAMAGVQLEVGQNPTSFEHEPFERTLQSCRRYYHKIDSSDSIYQRLGQGQAYSNDDAVLFFHHVPEMRGIPTLDHGTLSDLAVGLSGLSAKSMGSLTIDTNTDGANTTCLIAGDVADDGLSAGNVVQIFSNNNTNGYIAFKAEL